MFDDCGILLDVLRETRITIPSSNHIWDDDDSNSIGSWTGTTEGIEEPNYSVLNLIESNVGFVLFVVIVLVICLSIYYLDKRRRYFEKIN